MFLTMKLTKNMGEIGRILKKNCLARSKIQNFVVEKIGEKAEKTVEFGRCFATLNIL